MYKLAVFSYPRVVFLTCHFWDGLGKGLCLVHGFRGSSQIDLLPALSVVSILSIYLNVHCLWRSGSLNSSKRLRKGVTTPTIIPPAKDAMELLIAEQPGNCWRIEKPKLVRQVYCEVCCHFTLNPKSICIKRQKRADEVFMWCFTA